MSTIFIYITFGIVTLLLLSFLVIVFGWRIIIKKMVAKVTTILFNDSYQENLLELIPGLSHIGIQNVLENNLRSSTGKVLQRPLGSPRSRWPHLQSLTFIPAQTSPFPVDGDCEVDIAVTLGPKAKQPMTVKIPLLISGMGYGISVSEQMRQSFMEAAKEVDTALNSGQGGILEEEVEQAGKYILQFSKTDWAKEEKLIQRADMIEIKLGLGALGGMGTTIPADQIQGRAQQVLGLAEGEDAVIRDNFFEDQTLDQIKELVHELRDLSGGVPIGVKIGAGGRLEEDLSRLIELNVDFITLDGGQAAMVGGPPILFDDFGIPTLHAVVRAVNYLKKRKVKDDISLLVSGGLMNPGHFLKVLALGADAVYVGSAMLYAVTHTQATKALPFEPPTQVVWYAGKYKDEFNVEEGAKAAGNFLAACAEEIKIALRAMGKRSLTELTTTDLVSYDELVAKEVGVPYTFHPYPRERR